MDYRDSDSDRRLKYSFKAKIFLLILFPIFAPFVNKAQLNADIGVMSGISYYMGDINPSKHFYKPGIIYSGFYRYNFHKRYSLKGSATYFGLRGSDSDFPENEFQLERNEKFDIKIIDISVQIEHNFWPYLTTLIEKDRFSPYIFTGFSGFYLFGERSSISYGIPLGAGFKYNLNKRIGLGIEYSFRKTFTDNIDGYLTNDYNFNHTKDWYSFLGFLCSYKIFTKDMYCPAYDN